MTYMKNSNMLPAEPAELKLNLTCFPTDRKLDFTAIEQRMQEGQQIDVPVRHTFCDGLYYRQVSIPAGALIMGKRHRFRTLNILLSGTLTFFMEDGSEPITLTGPATFVSVPGTKKLAYAHDDCIYANVHPTKETDLDKIEEMFIIPETEYLAEQQKAQLGAGGAYGVDSDRNDRGDGI